MQRFLLICSVLLSGLFFAQNRLNLIPYPQKVELLKGEFTIPGKFKLDQNLSRLETEYFKKQIRDVFTFGIGKKETAHLVNVPFSAPSKRNPENEEKYAIEISPRQIVISSNTKQGYFLALQTLIQLFRQYKDSGKIPAMKIEDEPKFAWRGMHLDVSRHFLRWRK
uniref:beta-N-acetylhexosaminidase n=1 Tax=Chryseobacterium endophyticum TaxID=1854762 RepID=A0AAU6WTP0_9FLAO